MLVNKMEHSYVQVTHWGHDNQVAVEIQITDNGRNLKAHRRF